MTRFPALASVAIAVLFVMVGLARAQEQSIVVQSTTSTANSGLYDHLLPAFEKASGIKVRVVAVGTGQAIKNARNCDGDVLFVHAKVEEEKFVADGYGVKRYDVMYNDFIIVGPAPDPAKISGSTDAVASMAKIAATKNVFASRGDNSGTHLAERELWRLASIDPKVHSGTWYRETGSGMGATLNTGIGMGGYILTDRGTWISFKNKAHHKVVVEGDRRLFNPYGVTRTSEVKCPNVKVKPAQAFVDWLVSRDGQSAISAYKISGQQLFFPDAHP